MKRVKVERILEEDKSFILNYDQGLEHGPVDFNLNNIDPDYIIDIAIKGKFNGLIVQKGIAEQYSDNYYRQVPLIVKLNGKTKLANIEPISVQNCSVKRAVDFGAAAVAYTIYIGSAWENKMLEEFGKIQEEAHDYGLPVIACMLPQGRNVASPKATSTIAYATRTGLELGADFVRVHYNKIKEEFKWVVHAAGKCKVLMAGGVKIGERELLHDIDDVIKAGCTGLSVGRNIWQHKQPVKMALALRSIIFEGKDVEEALRHLG